MYGRWEDSLTQMPSAGQGKDRVIDRTERLFCSHQCCTAYIVVHEENSETDAQPGRAGCDRRVGSRNTCLFLVVRISKYGGCGTTHATYKLLSTLINFPRRLGRVMSSSRSFTVFVDQPARAASKSSEPPATLSTTTTTADALKENLHPVTGENPSAPT